MAYVTNEGGFGRLRPFARTIDYCEEMVVSPNKGTPI